MFDSSIKQGVKVYSLQSLQDNENIGKVKVGAEEIFDQWWNSSWRFRIPVEINTTTKTRVNMSVPIKVNFSYYLETLGYLGERFDRDSIRVIEYNESGYPLYEVPYIFINGSNNYDPVNNAYGWIIFLVNGTTPPNTLRRFYVYFDTIENGQKQKKEYPDIIVQGWWEQFYHAQSQNLPAQQPDNIYGDFIEGSERTISAINYPATTSRWEDYLPYNYFCANWTAWLYVLSEGTYAFETESDDGSWLYLNDTQVVNNGWDHSMRGVREYKVLQEGVHKITVRFYENRGSAGCIVRWLPPWMGSVSLIQPPYVYCFKYSSYIDFTNPPNIRIGIPTAGLVIHVYVKDMNNMPVDGANVTLINVTSGDFVKNGTTKAGGDVYLVPSFTGDYRVDVNYTTAYPEGLSKKIIVENFTEITMSEDDFGKVKEITIYLSIADFQLKTTDLDGKPVPNVYVNIFNDSGVVFAERNSSVDGIVTLTRFPSGVYRVNMSLTAVHDTVSGPFSQYIERTNATVDFSKETSREVSLPMGTLNLTVTDMLGQDLGSDCLIKLYLNVTHYIQKFTVKGKVVFENLKADNYNLSFIYIGENARYGEILEETLNVSRKEDRLKTIILPLASLRVSVVDVNGLPIKDASVDAEVFFGGTWPFNGKTDDNGVCEFRRVLAYQNWTITTVLITPYGETLSNVTRIFLDEAEFNVKVVLDVTDFVVRVFTRDHVNASGAVVSVNITNGRAVANATGFAVLKLLPVGTYEVVVEWLGASYDGFENHESNVFFVCNNSVLDLQLAVEVGGVTPKLEPRGLIGFSTKKNWTEVIRFNVTFFVELKNGSKLFVSGATLNWTLYDLDGNVIAFGSLISTSSPGIYLYVFNTSSLTANEPYSTYILKIEGFKAGYPPPDSLPITVEIYPVPTVLICEEGDLIYDIEEGTEFLVVRVWFVDLLHKVNITEANITLLFLNQTYSMKPSYSYPGMYECSIPTKELQQNTLYNATVIAEKENYKTSKIVLTINVKWKTIKFLFIKIPLPVFIPTVISTVSICSSVFAYFIYRYLKVPKVIRLIDKISKYLNTGEPVPLKVITDIKMREELVREKVKDRFKGIGFDDSMISKILLKRGGEEEQ